MQENLNLIQKLAKIRAMSDAVAKSKRGYNYSYEDITEILANVTAGMKRYGVSLIPTVTPGTSQVSQNVIRKTKVDKTGKPYETVTHIYIPMFDQQSIYTAVKKVKHTQGLDVLIVDYFKGSGDGDAFDSYQELGRFVDWIQFTLRMRTAATEDFPAGRSATRKHAQKHFRVLPPQWHRSGAAAHKRKRSFQK